jgi:hypothetical protein
MMRRTRRFDQGRCYASLIVTAALLAGCSSADLTGPGTGTETGTTGARKYDRPYIEQGDGSGKPILRRCAPEAALETCMPDHVVKL